ASPAPCFPGAVAGQPRDVPDALPGPRLSPRATRGLRPRPTPCRWGEPLHGGCEPKTSPTARRKFLPYAVRTTARHGVDPTARPPAGRRLLHRAALSAPVAAQPGRTRLPPGPAARAGHP